MSTTHHHPHHALRDRGARDSWGRGALLVLAATLLLSPAPPSAGGAPAAQPAPTLGGLLVAPTRVVLEGRRRAAQLTLVNRGAAPATYRISFVQMRMSLDGALQGISSPEPGAPSSEPLVRYSPRQVELAPGESQTVRLMVRKPGDLPPGEYRSHLVLRAVPAVGSSPAAPAASGSGSVGFRLIPVYGVSIPVIVRHGETAASLALDRLELVPPASGEAASLGLVLAREGTRSVYGDVVVEWRPRRGSPREIGRLRKLAVYTPNGEREVTVPLRDDPATLAGGSVEVRFENGEEGGQAGEVLARATMAVP